MKGILRKKEDVWVVKYNSPLEFKEPAHELELTPDGETEQLQSLEGKQVEFNIQKVFLSDKTLWYAKLVLQELPDPIKKAQILYRDAYMRWCYELSHEKNVLTAKDICLYLCNEMISYVETSKEQKFWTEVKENITSLNHRELYNGN
jgi:hypothetical protein